jgi:hypothetical protein
LFLPQRRTQDNKKKVYISFRRDNARGFLLESSFKDDIPAVVHRMNRARSFRIGFAILLAASVFASSVSACPCANHPDERDRETASCHDHPLDKALSDPGRPDASFHEAGCFCIQPGPKAAFKSETLKLKKQAATAAAAAEPEVSGSIASAFVAAYSSPRLDLPESFPDAIAARGPPSL